MSASAGPTELQEDNDAEESSALLLAGGDVSGCSLSEQWYIDSGNEKKVLYLLCFGLLNRDKEPLFSLEKEPWSLLPKTLFLRPKNIDFVNEIARRANLFNIAPAPRPVKVIGLESKSWSGSNATRCLTVQTLNSLQTRWQGCKVC